MSAWFAQGIRAPLALGLLGLIAWPLVFSGSYDLRIFTLAGIYALLVIGYQFVFGRIGALALTQGSFFGLGAYVTGILAVRYGWGFPATLALSVVLPTLLAGLIAIPVLRLESHYFALATLGIAQVLLLICLEWTPVTGGANGISGIPGVAAFGREVPRGAAMLLVVWGGVILGAGIAWQILRGLYGLAFHVARQAPVAALAVGLDVPRLRLVAFLLSAAYAGAAGALFVHVNRLVSPDVLEFHVMVTCLAMTVIGGSTRISGAIAGAMLLVYLPEWFRVLDKYYLIAYGAAVLVMIVVAPDGLIGALERLRRRVMPEVLVPPPPSLSLPARPRSGSGDGPILEFRGVSRAFGGVRALSGVSFEVRRGEILGLIGPNGSGKTTLVNIATGFESADSGEIRLDGRTLTRAHPAEIARLGVARTFQNICLVDDLSALDNVAVGRCRAEKAGLRRAVRTPPVDAALARARGMAAALLDDLGLAGVAMTLAGALPHGIRRRVEIARALALQPDVLFLDEPAAGLSESEHRELASQLRKLKQSGLTIVVIEHNMPFLTSVADRMVCLDGGQVIASGAPADVRRHERVVEAYLGGPAEVAS